MPYDANGVWQPEDDSVATKLNGLLQPGNPLMKQARATGLQIANKRGLMNSSIASGAGTAEALKVAVPMASQDAQQSAQKNLARMSLDSQEKISTGNIAAHDRQYLASSLAEKEKTYAALFSDLQKNADLSAEARNRYFQHISALRDSSFDLARQVYGVELTWAPAVVTS